MINTENKNRRFSVRVLALLCVFVLTLTSIISLSSCKKDEEESNLSEKEKIERNIEKMEKEDKDYTYVASYLSDFGFKNFDSLKFKKIELYFGTYYVKELEKAHALANKTARLFLDYIYDKIDLEDKTTVTDSLIDCYVEASGDRYAAYRDAKEFQDFGTDMSGSFAGIGVVIRYDREKKEMTVIEVNEGSGAEEAGILEGDKLVSVEGKTLQDTEYDDLVKIIRGEEGTKVSIGIVREGKTLNLEVMRKHIEEKTVKYEINEKRIGYIKITRFKENTPDQFIEALDFMQKNRALGIVFDMRDNPGGYLNSVIRVIDALVPKDTRIVSYQQKMAPTVVYYAETERSLDIPSVVLCNGHTASAGELFTAAMRDYNKMGILDCSIVGETTYGKGLMQSSYLFPDKSAITLTVAFYNPPSNVNYDGIGIVPDIVRKNEDDLIDSQLQSALNEVERLIFEGDINGIAA